MPLVATPLRFALDLTRRKTETPNIGTDTTDVVIWFGEPLEVQASLFNGDSTVASNFVTDLSNVSSATLTLRVHGPNGALLVNKTISSFDTTTDFTSWSARTKQQFKFELSSLDTRVALPTDGSLGVYGVISLNLTSGDILTLGWFNGELSLDGSTATGVPPPPLSSYYTSVQSDARYQPINASLSTISGQTNTSFGLGILSLVDQPAAATYLGFVITTDSRLSNPRAANAIVTASTKAIDPTLDPTDQQFLSYSSSSGMWRPKSAVASDVGLGSLTNDVQTKASIVPNTLPTAGQLLVGNVGGTAYAPVTLSGSGCTATLSSLGVLTLSAILSSSLTGNIPAAWLGATSTTAAAGNDSRLSDSRVANAIATLTTKAISTIADPTDGQCLGYDATAGKWKPITPPGAGGGSPPGGASGQLQYNSSGVFGGIPTLLYNGTITTQQVGTKYALVDSTDVTKQLQFDASGITTGITRTVTIPNANSTFAQPIAALSHYWLTSMSASGLFVQARPDFTDLSGVASTVQIPYAGVNAQTASFAPASVDSGKLITMNGSNLTLTLPATPPNGNWNIYVQNLNATSLTVSRNGTTINGGSTDITLTRYAVIHVFTDGTNYFSNLALVAGAGIGFTLTTSSLTIAVSGVTEALLTLADNTTANVSSSLHGFAPKSVSDSTKFLNSAATPVYAQVKDSDLSFTDITTNNSSTAQHGFLKKLDNTATHFMDGTGNWSTPASGGAAQFAQTSSVTVANTTTETSLKGTIGVGSDTIPANTFTVGKNFRFTAWGYLTNKLSGPGTVTIKFKIGTTTLTFTAVTPSVSTNQTAWKTEVFGTCRTTGGAGAFAIQGQIIGLFNASAGLASNYSSSSTSAIDTTVSQTVDLSWTWATADTNNTTTCTNMILELL